MARIVVALGGNALGNTPFEQQEMVANAAKTIVNLVEQGNELIIAHGNGPQAGMKFASSKAGRKAVICSLAKADLAMSGKSGTIIRQ